MNFIAAGLFAVLAGLTGASSVSAQPLPIRDTQEILQEATKYTVRIRAQVRYAFSGESSGTGSGAGFLVDRQRGWILTNSHVARRSPGRLDVAFVDGEYQPAKRLYVDPHFDLAVISVSPETIPLTATTAALGCGEDVPIGSAVAGFGHPFGLRFSATRGIVSALRYRYPAERIQTDVAINPGNSGGPLIELNRGRVVGVNYARLGAANSAGLGFAVPINHVCRILDLMHEGKDPSPIQMPIALAQIDQREELVIAKSGPGDWQALRAGDRVVSVDGAVGLKNHSQLVTKLRGRTTPFEIVVSRAGALHTIRIQPSLTAPLIGQVGIGVSGMILTAPWLPDDIDLNPERYLVVSHVDNASEAWGAQVGALYVLVSLNGRSFSDPEALYAYLSGPDKPKRITAIFRARSPEPVSHFAYYEAAFAVSDVRRIEAK